VHADVDARERDRSGEEVERQREPRRRPGEDRRAREARGRVSGRERVVGRHADERLREGVANRRPVAVDHRLARQREQVGEPVGGEHGEQEPRPAPQEREHQRDRDPDETERPDLRQPDEEMVGRAGAVVDDETLELPV
jgi:hypothetical protein